MEQQNTAEVESLISCEHCRALIRPREAWRTDRMDWLCQACAVAQDPCICPACRGWGIVPGPSVCDACGGKG